MERESLRGRKVETGKFDTLLDRLLELTTITEKQTSTIDAGKVEVPKRITSEEFQDINSWAPLEIVDWEVEVP